MGLLLFISLVLPLLFVRGLYNPYTVPKFSLLLITAPILLYVLASEILRGRIALTKRMDLFRLALGLEVLGVLVGTLHSAHPLLSFWGHDEGRVGAFSILYAVCCALAARHFCTTVDRLKKLSQWILFTGLLSSLLSLGLFVFKLSDRMDGTVGNPNFLTNYLLFPALCSVGVFFSSRDRLHRLLASLCLAVTVMTIALSGTRGAQVGLMTGIVTFGFLFVLIQARRMTGKAAGLLAGLGLLGVGILFYGFATRQGLGSSGRLLLWRDSLPLLSKAWILGIGIDGFEHAFLPYRSLELAKVFANGVWGNAHNQALQTWITMGMVGILAYGLQISAGLLGGWRSVRKHAQSDALLSAGFLAALVAALTHNLFNCDVIVTLVYFHLFVGAAWGMSRGSSEQETRSPNPGAIRMAQIVTAVAMGLLCVVAVRLVAADLSAYNCWKYLAQRHDAERSLTFGNRAVSWSPWKGLYTFVLATSLDTASANAPAGTSERYTQLGIENCEKAKQYECTDTSYTDVRLAHLYLNSERWSDAERTLQEALARDPHSWEAKRLMAKVCMATKKDEEALQWATQGLQIYCSERVMWETYRQCWDLLVPQEARVLFAEARELSKRKELEAAVATYRQAIEKAQDRYPEAWNDLGVMMEAQGNISEAVSCYEKALALTHGLLPESHVGLGAMLLKMGQKDKAALSMEEACRLQPAWALPRRHLALIYHELNQPKKAKQVARQYISLLNPAERESMRPALEAEIGRF